MRLLSYNIHKGIGGLDRRYNLDRIVQVMERENPDLICLQEVTQHARRNRGDDQPALLSRATGFSDFIFQMNVHYRRGGYGNLILSRWPFLVHHHISLRQNSRKPRGAQLVTIDSPEGPLCIVNCHLGLAEGERRWQTRHLLNHPFMCESRHLPTMVVGDCNDWRNRLAGGPFAEHGMVPVAIPPSRFRSFPAFLPGLSLDKAFHHGLFIRAATIVRNPLAHRASDHLPLMVDFHLSDPTLR